MIVNFEEITKELNNVEKALIPILIKEFNSHTKTNPIKAPDLVRKINQYIVKTEKEFLTEPRLRKCCNYIRANSMLPLIATKSGYFVSYDRNVISSQILSLQQRASSILICSKGLESFLS